MVAVDDSSSTQSLGGEVLCASKPKEGRFQVVHVPGVFTRGRWRCRDYREESAPGQDAASNIVQYSDKENDCPAAAATVPQANAPQVSVVPSTSLNALNEPVPTAQISPSREHSSTILVTSIAPAPSTPLHGTPGSALEDICSSPPQQQQINEEAAAISNTTAPDSTPVEGEPMSAANFSVVTIDNKIEQAMDLVKTHLTFAVREQVEAMRTTIAELENKVASLTEQNAVLRRYVNPDVLQNLPSLVTTQKQTTSSPATVTTMTMTTTQPAPPVAMPAAAAHCAATRNLATTLNTIAMPLQAQNNLPSNSFPPSTVFHQRQSAEEDQPQ